MTYIMGTQRQQERYRTDASQRLSGPPAAMVLILVCVLVLVIAGLALLGTWLTFAFAIALLLCGVIAMSLYVWNAGRGGRTEARREPGLPDADDARDEGSLPDKDTGLDLSPHDIPPDNPARRELLEHRHPDR
jgi:hypothetical protein